MFYHHLNHHLLKILGQTGQTGVSFLSRGATFFALISLFLLAAIPGVQAAGTTRVYLQNVPVEDEKLLVVNVMLAEMQDLYGADIQLRYNPAQMKARDENPRLEGIQITPGPLLASDARFVATNRADLESGQIDFVFTLLKPASPLNGEGALATIAFEVLDTGPYAIEISRAKLVSAQLEAIPVTTQDLYLNGALQPIAQPQYLVSSGSAWQWWRTITLISLLLALALLVVLRSKWVVATLVGWNGGQPAPQRVSNSARSSLRSSALLAEQGHHALGQNEVERAYELFSQAIELDPANAKAWLGRGLVTHQRMEKLICFQRVLALDPNNRQAKTELNRLTTPDSGMVNGHP